MDGNYTLYDLTVEVLPLQPGAQFVCRHTVGVAFTVTDDDIITFQPGASFTMYGLAALLILLPAKQRPTQEFDWMTSDNDIACPDPECGARFRIVRGAAREYLRSENTATPFPADATA